MRPIPHTNKAEGEETDEQHRQTSRRKRSQHEPADDETWLAVQEF